jgi:4-aminobutyrate aminotransferase-like enzyme
LLPPLVINQSEAEQLVAILAKLIMKFLSEQ